MRFGGFTVHSSSPQCVICVEAVLEVSYHVVVCNTLTFQPRSTCSDNDTHTPAIWQPALFFPAALVFVKDKQTTEIKRLKTKHSEIIFQTKFFIAFSHVFLHVWLTATWYKFTHILYIVTWQMATLLISHSHLCFELKARFVTMFSLFTL